MPDRLSVRARHAPVKSRDSPTVQLVLGRESLQHPRMDCKRYVHAGLLLQQGRLAASRSTLYMPCPDAQPILHELTSRTLGPIQTLYESLNRFISLGGNNHINRLQAEKSGKQQAE
jgi:hypothetical protein